MEFALPALMLISKYSKLAPDERAEARFYSGTAAQNGAGHLRASIPRQRQHARKESLHI